MQKTDKSSIRICFLSPTAELYGAENALLELMLALHGMDPDLAFFVILPRQGPLCLKLARLGIPFRIIPVKDWCGNKIPFYRRILRLFFNISLIPFICLEILRFKSSLVYTNTILIWTGALCAKILSLPHIWHVHEFGQEDHQLEFDWGEKVSHWIMNRLTTRFIMISRAVARKYLKKWPGCKIHTVYQSVTLVSNSDADKVISNKLHDNSFHCIFAGRFDPGKRAQDAIHALSLVRKSGINADLTILGTGTESQEHYLKNLAEKLYLENTVFFAGFIDSIHSCMKWGHVFLMCSAQEAFGRVTIEAMQAGIPVIAAQSGSGPELINNGFNGLLYPAGDQKALASCIISLAENRKLALEIGENGKKWAFQKFTRERYGRDIMNILQKL